MQLLPLDKLGPHVRAQGVDFGFVLPWVSASDGNRLFVKVIHEEDQFMQHVPARRFELTQSTLDGYGDYWSGSVELAVGFGSENWGRPGRYLYRYELESPLLDAPLD